MKKLRLIFIMLLVIMMMFGCGGKNEKFIVTESGKKQYKNDDGILIKNDWVELDGDKYYFDLNGYMVTNDWVQNEYYVGEDGKMKMDYWYNDEKNPQIYYYLGKDGKYVKDDIVEIGKKKYAFDKSGNWIKNATYEVEKYEKYVIANTNGIVVVDEGLCEIGGKEYYVKNDGYILLNDWKEIDGKKAYFNEEGQRVYKGFGILESIISTESEIKKWCYIDEKGDILKSNYVLVDDLYYCADKDGVLLSNQWDEYDGKKYYYGKDCYMLKNQFVEDVYYVDENGEMVTNKELTIEGKNYTFGSDGRGNIKVIKKTSNANWEIRKYSNSERKYVENKYYFTGSGGEKFLLIVDDEDLRMKMYWASSGRLIKKTEDTVRAIVSVNSNRLIDLENVTWDSDGYIIFNSNQRKKILDALMVDSNKLIVVIGEYSSTKTYTYSAIVEAEGFAEIYSALF